MERLSAIEILALARKRSIQSGITNGSVTLTQDEITIISAELLGIEVEEPVVETVDKSTVQLPGDDAPGFFHEEEAETSG